MSKLRPLGNALPTQDFLDQLKEAVEQIRGNRRSNISLLTADSSFEDVRDTLNALLVQLQGGTYAPLSRATPWYYPTLQNGWTNFGAGYPWASYMKDALGYVHLRGLIASGTLDSSKPFFTLPPGFRPGMQCGFASFTSNGAANQAQRIDVTAAGLIYTYTQQELTGTAGWLFLDPVVFKAEQ
jgi:hypothetical protein